MCKYVYIHTYIHAYVVDTYTIEHVGFVPEDLLY